MFLLVGGANAQGGIYDLHSLIHNAGVPFNFPNLSLNRGGFSPSAYHGHAVYQDYYNNQHYNYGRTSKFPNISLNRGGFSLSAYQRQLRMQDMYNNYDNSYYYNDPYYNNIGISAQVSLIANAFTGYGQYVDPYYNYPPNYGVPVTNIMVDRYNNQRHMNVNYYNQQRTYYLNEIFRRAGPVYLNRNNVSMNRSGFSMSSSVTRAWNY